MSSNDQTKQGIHIGAIVTVKGYGGRAKVLNMQQDGITPQGHPKWLCDVVFGPYSSSIGTVTRFNGKKNGQTLKRTPGISSPIHQFYAGRLTNITDETAANEATQDQDMDIDQMDQAAILARLAEINTQLQEV